MRHLSLFCALLASVTLVIAGVTPQAPELEWLFTVNFDAHPNPAPLLPGPSGSRLDVALTGGNYTDSNGVTGKMRPLSDWAILDSRTGLAFADARWAIVLPATESTRGQEATVYVKSTGPSAPPLEDGTFVLHLRLVLETGVPEYYWMNNIVVIGILEIKNIDVLFDPTSEVTENVHIEAFRLKSGWKPTDEVFTCLYDVTSGCPNHGDASRGSARDEL
ncbi:hypothetical protein JCM3766R1_003302 [Sporobolomyces carnicolor]